MNTTGAQRIIVRGNPVLLWGRLLFLTTVWIALTMAQGGPEKMTGDKSAGKNVHGRFGVFEITAIPEFEDIFKRDLSYYEGNDGTWYYVSSNLPGRMVSREAIYKIKVSTLGEERLKRLIDYKKRRNYREINAMPIVTEYEEWRKTIKWKTD